MSEDGRESLLRLRALARRFAAPVPLFAETGNAEATIERLAEGGLPLVDFDPLGEMGADPKPQAAGSPLPVQAKAPAAAGKEIAPRAGSEPPVFRLRDSRGAAEPRARPAARESLRRSESPSPSPGEPVGLELVASLLARIEAGDSPPSSPQGPAPAARKPLASPLPPRNRERPAPPRAAEPRGGAAAPESTAGPSRATTSLDRGPLSPSPSLVPAEPVGLGLVASLLARIDPHGPPANAPRSVSPATRTSFGAPPPTHNRERTTPPAAAEPPSGRDALAGTGASIARPVEERPIARPFPASRTTERTKAPAEPAPFGGLAASQPSGGSALEPSASPLAAAQPSSPALDPDLLADLVNDALVAQAVRFGIDLS